MAVEQTITIYRGEAATLDFTMDPVENITGWTIPFTVARKANSTTKLLTQAATIISGPAGTFRVSLTEEQTDLAPGTYWHDAWRNDEGFEQVISMGPFVVAGTARTPVAAV